MNESYTITTAKLSDSAFVTDLWTALGWDPSPDYVETLIGLLGPQFRLVRSTQDDCPVGTAIASNYGLYGFIGYIALVEAYRGKGLGKRLLQDSVDYLEQRGCTSIGLDAVPSAVGLYEGHGFQAVGDPAASVNWARKAGTTMPPDRAGKPGSIEVSELSSGDTTALHELGAADRATTAFERCDFLGKLLETPGWKAWHTCGSFIVARPTGSGYGVGPFYAKSQDQAEALMRTMLSSLGSGPEYYAECSANDAACRQVYMSFGWEADDAHTYQRMWRGSPPDDGEDDSVTYAILDAGLG